jgi:hypothetical protein
MTESYIRVVSTRSPRGPPFGADAAQQAAADAVELPERGLAALVPALANCYYDVLPANWHYFVDSRRARRGRARDQQPDSLEALNSKMRLLSHRAYGLHSADALSAMIYLLLAGIPIALPHR